jgi:hypothetical protein
MFVCLVMYSLDVASVFRLIVLAILGLFRVSSGSFRGNAGPEALSSPGTTVTLLRWVSPSFPSSRLLGTAPAEGYYQACFYFMHTQEMQTA